ncbi:uncharacterized protein LOC130739749 [Lotus japonicus]|uniref:uncharacterized protein LOC130739749 n=1 Tax=Lotus japonicus TaxID=34305 RepID=UPI002589F084|nr:uncharacterized protein LOC130739749 [Lotus japonicus]
MTASLRMLRVLRSSAPRFLTKGRRRTFAAPPPLYIDGTKVPFEKIQIPTKWKQRKNTFDGYFVGNGEGNAPGIVLLQDWLGVDYHVINHALRISRLGGGFKVLIPDVYGGNQDQLFKGYDWKGAMFKVHSSVEWLKTNGSKKVGVAGFCKGGALAVTCSSFFPPVDAVVAFYGIPGFLLANSHCPVQAHFGELDDLVGFSDVTAAKKLEGKLKESRVPHEVHIYPGYRHAFMNGSSKRIKRWNGMGLPDEDEIAVQLARSRPDEDEIAVQLAWSRFETWMTRFLSS